MLASLNADGGRVLGLDTVAQQLEREGGYLAVAGKEGPTFLFDNRVETIKDGVDSIGNPHKDYLFVTDDLAEPAQPGSEKIPAGNADGRGRFRARRLLHPRRDRAMRSRPQRSPPTRGVPRSSCYGSTIPT